jgi:hypothetical protein
MGIVLAITAMRLDDHDVAALEGAATDPAEAIDIIANNPMDQKVVDLSSSQHYSLVENAIYRSVFPPQGV